MASTTCWPIFDPKWIKEYLSKNPYQSLFCQQVIGKVPKVRNERINNPMLEDAPKLVIHTLCGEPVFYYFGTKADAKQLKNFDDITTLQGDAIVPQDILACPNCGQRIRVDQIQVAVHEQRIVNILHIDENINETFKHNIESKLKHYDNELKMKFIEEMSKKMNEEQKNQKKNLDQDFFWRGPEDDTKRIRDGESEKGE